MSEIEPNKLISSSPNNLVTWDEIELAESYLVSGMFEEAIELACSDLTRIQQSEYTDNRDEICDMKASLAMVLVQAWRESKSACVQVSNGHPSGVRDLLEDFLEKWQFDNEKYFVCANPDTEKSYVGAYEMHST